MQSSIHRADIGRCRNGSCNLRRVLLRTTRLKPKKLLVAYASSRSKSRATTAPNVPRLRYRMYKIGRRSLSYNCQSLNRYTSMLYAPTRPISWKLADAFHSPDRTRLARREACCCDRVRIFVASAPRRRLEPARATDEGHLCCANRARCSRQQDLIS